MQAYTDSTASVGRLPSVSLGAATTHAVPGMLRNALTMGGDLLLMLAILFCIPFVMLAIGIPIALFLRLLLWVAGL